MDDFKLALHSPVARAECNCLRMGTIFAYLPRGLLAEHSLAIICSKPGMAPVSAAVFCHVRPGFQHRLTLQSNYLG